MIIINENIKNGCAVNRRNFPHLFQRDYNGKDVQYTNFFWRFDLKYNMFIETTISDKNELKNKIKFTLESRKETVLKKLLELNNELNAINEMLERC